jgi:hypothetical protein
LEGSYHGVIDSLPTFAWSLSKTTKNLKIANVPAEILTDHSQILPVPHPFQYNYDDGLQNVGLCSELAWLCTQEDV